MQTGLGGPWGYNIRTESIPIEWPIVKAAACSEWCGRDNIESPAVTGLQSIYYMLVVHKYYLAAMHAGCNGIKIPHRDQHGATESWPVNDTSRIFDPCPFFNVKCLVSNDDDTKESWSTAGACVSLPVLTLATQITKHKHTVCLLLTGATSLLFELYLEDNVSVEYHAQWVSRLVRTLFRAAITFLNEKIRNIIRKWQKNDYHNYICSCINSSTQTIGLNWPCSWMTSVRACVRG